MDKKQLQQLIIILPIAIVAGVFCYYKYLLSPLNAKQKTIESELENIKKEFRESRRRAARLPQLQKEIAVLNQEITQMQKKLPPKKDVSGLLRLLSKRMEHYNITWSRIVPGPKSVKTHHIENSYSIPFSTPYYHDFAKFLTEIGQMERIFATKFNSLKSSVDSQTGLATMSGTLSFFIYTSKQ